MPPVTFVYGEWLTAMGRFEEAVVELERALDFDPLSSPISANLAAAYCFVRQYHRALEQIRKTVELDPSFIAAQALHAVLSRARVLRPRRRGGAEVLLPSWV